MDTTQITPEELAAEQAATKEVKEEEIRASVISEYGFDEEADKDRIDKLVSKELESRKALSAAIGQKIKHRTDAEELRKKVTPPSQDAPKTVAPEEIGKLVASELDKRDLDALDYPAELKQEIQRVAQAQGISIKQAARDPYIVFKIGEHDKAQKADEAAIKRTNQSGGKKNYTFDSPPNVDMATEEGRKEYDSWKEEMKRQGH